MDAEHSENTVGRLLLCQKKSKLKAMARAITLTEQDLVRARETCESATVALRHELIFSRGKRFAGHYFWMPGTKLWWLLYFSSAELSPVGNHWRCGGTHIHVVCWLTHPQQEASEVLWKFLIDPWWIGRHLHVRYAY